MTPLMLLSVFINCAACPSMNNIHAKNGKGGILYVSDEATKLNFELTHARIMDIYSTDEGFVLFVDGTNNPVTTVGI